MARRSVHENVYQKVRKHERKLRRIDRAVLPRGYEFAKENDTLYIVNLKTGAKVPFGN